jgi:plasmid stabilization system protein ParE
MIRKIKLSGRTERKLNKLLEYLETEWSEKVKKDFVARLEKSLEKIKQYPESFPQTDFVKGLHKCVVTKQTTIYYKYDDTNVYVVTLFDNRQDPQKLQKETKD